MTTIQAIPNFMAWRALWPAEVHELVLPPIHTDSCLTKFQNNLTETLKSKKNSEFLNSENLHFKTAPTRFQQSEIIWETNRQ